MSDEWTVSTRVIGHLSVTVFPSKRSATYHVEKHFLSVDERWDDLCVEQPTAAQCRTELAAAKKEAQFGVSPETAAVLEKSTHRYVGLVRAQTADDQVLEVRIMPYKDKFLPEPVETAYFLTRGAIVCAFRTKAPSELRTALRRRPVRTIRNPSARHYVDAGRKYLNSLSARANIKGN